MRKHIQFPIILAASSTLFAEMVSYRLTWEANSAAKGYEVNVLLLIFSKVVQLLKTTTNEARFSMEPAEPKYFWRYRSVDAAGKQGAWSQVAELQKPATSDTIPPLEISSDSMPSTGGESGVYSLKPGQSLVITFNPKDSVSGMGEVYARVNGGGYTLCQTQKCV